MIEFIRYYIDFLRTLWDNFIRFLRNFFGAIGKFFFSDVGGYFDLLASYSKNFNVLDWIAAVVIISLNIAFVVFLVIKILQLLRAYFKFNRSEITKEKLVDEITLLSEKLVEVNDEKNQILALKMETIGLSPDMRRKFEGTKKEKVKTPSRFTKLIQVDEEYAEDNLPVVMSDSDAISLAELVERFINFAASQLHLYYEFNVIASFFAGLATTKLIILEGISGTGKTSLPYAMGKFFSNPADIISVQPSWRDRSEMIGYLNEFTKKFNELDFLKALYEANYRDDINIIVLDELNLARIEYYFAEFLSVMEMPNTNDWLVEIVPSVHEGDPKKLMNGKVLVSQNLWFVGTANKDDSTFTITDKVYDRAAIIEMDARIDKIDAPITQPLTMSYEYLNNLFEIAKKEHQLSISALNGLDQLDAFITDKFRITFGNRILKQMKDFVPVYVACGGTELDGLDYFIARKILRKFESLNLPFLVEELKELITIIRKIFGKNNFKHCIGYIESLLRQI